MKTLAHRFEYGLSIFILAVSAFAAAKSAQFQPVSRWFPLFVSVTAVVVSALVIAFDVAADVRAKRRDDDSETEEDSTPAREVLLGFAKYMSWFIGFAVLFVLFGMPLAVLAWVLGFIRFAAGEPWLRSAASAVALTAGLIVLAAVLALALPHGLLIDSGAVIPNWRL